MENILKNNKAIFDYKYLFRSLNMKYKRQYYLADSASLDLTPSARKAV